jgi:hypothetical protein
VSDEECSDDARQTHAANTTGNVCQRMPARPTRAIPHDSDDDVSESEGGLPVKRRPKEAAKSPRVLAAKELAATTATRASSLDACDGEASDVEPSVVAGQESSAQIALSKKRSNNRLESDGSPPCAPGRAFQLRILRASLILDLF